MIWGYLYIFFFSMVKFIFSPLAAKLIEGHTWYYTYFVVSLGGLVGTTFFYYSAKFFIESSLKRRRKKGIIKRKFTKKNKLIIKTKNKLGVFGLALLTASFISIPIGSIITAKFYRHDKKTIVILYCAILFIAFITTTVFYLFFP